MFMYICIYDYVYMNIYSCMNSCMYVFKSYSYMYK